MCKVLSECYGPTLLLTVEGPLSKIEDSMISQRCFRSEEPNLLKRALLFSHWAKTILQEYDTLLIGHFRDVWGGLAVLAHPHILPIFEVNGLPSIEWLYRYPQLAATTLQKLTSLEGYCLKESSLVLTPSLVIKKHLLTRGVADEKIRVLSNGATIQEVPKEAPLIESPYILYFGALQAWQGVDVFLKAIPYLEDKTALKFVICASHHEHFCKPYRKLAERLNVNDRIQWFYQLDKTSLQNVVYYAYASVAPLVECSRNLEQGCSPLKIFESMAEGTPVIASDLPVVKEIIRHNENGVLVRAGRPAELARAIRLLADYPQQHTLLSVQAIETIQGYFTWEMLEHRLTTYYHQVYTFRHLSTAYRYG